MSIMRRMNVLYVVVDELAVRRRLSTGRGYCPGASGVLDEIQRIKAKEKHIAHDGSIEELLRALPSSRRYLHVVLVGAFENGSVQKYQEALRGAGYSVKSQNNVCLAR